MTTNPKDTDDAIRYPDAWCGHVLDRPEPDLEDVKCTTRASVECGLTTPSAKELDALPGQISRPVATHATVEAGGIDLSIKTTRQVCASKEPPPMDNPTDAAVEALANDLVNIYRGSPGLMKDRMLVVARHLLTRQPGPEDVERIRRALQTAAMLTLDESMDCARAILALYAPSPAPAHAPTRSALDSALDPMLGNTPVRKAVVDAVLGLFESAPKEHSTTDMEDRLATVLSQRSTYKADRDIANARVATLEAELAAAKASECQDCPWIEKPPVDTTAEDAARSWLHSYGIYTDHYQNGGVDHPAMSTLPQAFEAFAAATPPPSTIRLGEGLTESARDVIAERQRQVSGEGWTEAHDDGWQDGVLSKAAACYINWGSSSRVPHGTAPSDWPWSIGWWKPTTPRRDLVKAGALILAEIERIDRLASYRARATAKPEAVDWVKRARDYQDRDVRDYMTDVIINGLCDQIAALRAGGV